MTPDICLVQLISEQTLQNLLPVLRLRPRKLVHLVTPKTAGRSDLLRAAAHAAGLDPLIEVIGLTSMPGIPECHNAVMDAIEQARLGGMEPIVNFTGGTKLMSIGAFSAALREKIPSLYVDTQDACFVDGATSAEMQARLGGDWSFTPVRNQLRVDVIGTANGVARITGGRPWQALVPLADRLFGHEADEQDTFGSIHGPDGLIPGGKEPHTPAGWLNLLDRPISLPAAVADLAVEAGLVRRGNASGTMYLPDTTRNDLEYLTENRVADFLQRYYRAVAPLQHTLGFLTGAWWEVIVCDAASKSGLFRDLRWSCQVGERNGPDTEEDILGIDGVELVYISCKRGGHKARLLPLLEEIRARAATIGGAFNRRFLAVHFPLRGKPASNLRQRAGELGVRLIDRENVYHPRAFSR